MKRAENFVLGKAFLFTLVLCTSELSFAGKIVSWGSNAAVSSIPPGNDYISIASGYNFSLALKSDGSLVAWGENSFGVPGGNDFVAVSAGSYRGLALRSDGALVGWGENSNGLFVVPTGNDYVAIDAGWWHNMALKTDGSFIYWGSNLPSEVTIPNGNDFVAIAAGGDKQSLVLKNDVCFCGWAVVAQLSSIIRLKSDICLLFFVCSSLNPFKGTIAFVSIGHSGVIRIGS